LDLKQQNHTTESQKVQSVLAAECDSVESRLREKILLTESEDTDHGCTTGEKLKKEDQYQPTVLWRFIEVLIDESQSDAIQVTFHQCKKNASCSKQRIQGQCSCSLTVLESETEGTRKGSTVSVPFKRVDETSNACLKRNYTFQPAEPSSSTGEMLLIKVIFV